MTDDAGTWILGGTFVLSLAVLFFGGLARLAGGPPVMPPALPGAGGFAGVPTGFYRWPDLAVGGFFVLMYASPLWLGGGGEGGGAEIGYGLIFATIVSQVFSVAIIFGLMVWRCPADRWLGLRWSGWPLVLAIGPAAVVATWAVAAALQWSGFNDWLIELTGSPARQGVVVALTETGDPWLLALLCFMAVIVAPLTEEIVFRGYLYPVAKRFFGIVPAAVFSSLLFALIHQHAVALLPLAFLALLMVLAYEFSGSIWAPIAIHLLFNAATVGAQLAARFGWIELPQP